MILRLVLSLALFAVAGCGQPAAAPPPPFPATPSSTAVRASATPMSAVAFRDHMIARLKASDASLQVEASGDLALKLKRDGAPGLLYLDSGYHEYLNDPDQLDAITTKWMDAFLGAQFANAMPTTASAEEIRDTLVIVLRHKSYLDNKGPNGEPIHQITRPFGGDLIQIIMVNSATTLASATPELLKQAGLDETSVWPQAQKNNIRLMGPLDMGDTPDGGPFVVSAASGLATGLLAGPGMCDATGSKYGDGRIALVVNRDSFIEGLPESKTSVERFWAFAKPHLGKGDLMSDTALSCKAGKWVEVKPPA